jgi:hypothetical protein
MLESIMIEDCETVKAAYGRHTSKLLVVDKKIQSKLCIIFLESTDAGFGGEDDFVNRFGTQSSPKVPPSWPDMSGT